LRCLLAHGGPIWGASLLPNPLLTFEHGSPAGSGGASQVQARSQRSGNHVIATCSGDGTVRLWALEAAGAAAVTHAATATRGVSRALLGVLVARVDDAATLNNDGCEPKGRKAAALSTAQSLSRTAAAGDAVVLRCVCASRDGRHLAAGDAAGNVRVYDLASLSLIALKEAHDGGVLCLDYSPAALAGAGFLVSGGRDGVLHIYDVAQGYTLVNTLDEHSAAVTAVRFRWAAEQSSILLCNPPTLSELLITTRGYPQFDIKDTQSSATCRPRMPSLAAP
jgi:WD40 repeat protein